MILRHWYNTRQVQCGMNTRTVPYQGAYFLGEPALAITYKTYYNTRNIYNSGAGTGARHVRHKYETGVRHCFINYIILIDQGDTSYTHTFHNTL
jgi:hypothetical protein